MNIATDKVCLCDCFTLLPWKGVQPSGVSGPHWKKSCLRPHIKYIATCNHKKKSYNVLSKFTIVCWATFTAILSHTWPVGCGLDTPGRKSPPEWVTSDPSKAITAKKSVSQVGFITEKYFYCMNLNFKISISTSIFFFHGPLAFYKMVVPLIWKVIRLSHVKLPIFDSCT